MLGIGSQLDKQTKIKILAEKAREYNGRAQELEGQQVEAEKIPEVMMREDY